MSADPYVYPGTEALINKFNIKDPLKFREIEGAVFGYMSLTFYKRSDQYNINIYLILELLCILKEKTAGVVLVLKPLAKLFQTISWIANAVSAGILFR